MAQKASKTKQKAKSKGERSSNIQPAQHQSQHDAVAQNTEDRLPIRQKPDQESKPVTVRYINYWFKVRLADTLVAGEFEPSHAVMDGGFERLSYLLA